MSLVEVFVTKIKILISKKFAGSFCSEALHYLIFNGSKVNLQLHILDLLIFPVQWLLKRALITWFNFDPGFKCFNMGHISDYPRQSAYIGLDC